MQKYCYLLLLFTFSSISFAQLSVQVNDMNNNKLSNIVVELKFSDPNFEAPAALRENTMQQVDQQFIPHILAIHKGEVVHFPDTDTVQHHVYSFSKARTFEIAIYQKEVSRKINFDAPGIVELGCNIHDWMLGYIYVAESPLYTKTNASGEAIFKSLPSGPIEVNVWHPRLSENDIKKTYFIKAANTQPTLHITLSEPLLPSYADFDDIHGVGDYE